MQVYHLCLQTKRSLLLGIYLLEDEVLEMIEEHYVEVKFLAHRVTFSQRLNDFQAIRGSTFACEVEVQGALNGESVGCGLDHTTHADRLNRVQGRKHRLHLEVKN